MLFASGELCVANSSISESQEENLLSTVEMLAIRKVYFHHCIFSRGIPSMIIANVDTAFLTHITFRSCGLTDSSLRLLSTVLENPESNLVSIDLLGNSFTNNGIIKLTDALENNWSLMRLLIEFDQFPNGNDLIGSVAMTRHFAETIASRLMTLNANNPSVLVDAETVCKLIGGGFAALNEVLRSTYNMRSSVEYVLSLESQLYEKEEFREFWNMYNNR